jgi:hypothetical protein
VLLPLYSPYDYGGKSTLFCPVRPGFASLGSGTSAGQVPLLGRFGQ